MKKEVAVCVGVAVVVLWGLALVQGCRSAGDESAQQVSTEPVVETPAETMAPPAEVEEAEPVKLTLSFVPGRTTTYTVTTGSERRIRWEGNTEKKPAAFTARRTGHDVEMTFEQQVERLEDNGDAIVKVTIKALKYAGQVQGKIVLDFDSAREQDPNNPLARLIGQTYKLQMTPRGQVAAVLDIEPAREAVQGVTPAHRTAGRLLSAKVVRERHEIPALTSLESETVAPSAHWSKDAAFAFDMLGAKAYERIYTFQGVERGGDTRAAVIAMKAIPSAIGAAPQGQAVTPFAGMFDNQDRYEGALRLDLNAGEIKDYSERLEAEWVIADPAALQSGDPNPAVLRMSATEAYKLERVD